ncbi:inositol monophosphatase [Glutamicibacter sp. MNS18]|uniref:inositol monophosphatase family protein n=1 Tax=Glutamicibacter sp. MNS18 TaxID=2989817 RepID=UPI002235ED6F|nr:inositol monophosphatase family protein [Glutamicibacter sp. MNS18]MCW4465168.1 inositol monophosphatase [Glutamicibacter sp. MNS18]
MVPKQPIDHDPLVLLSRQAAAAGARVLAGRTTGPLGLANKTEAGDWVTDYDRNAEEAIRNTIITTRPNDELTGEEFGHHTPGKPSGYRWSIDPLDGTANFVRGIHYYASSVAVCRTTADGGEQWLAGAISAPALGVEYYAGRGLGAWKHDLKSHTVTRLQGPMDSDAKVLSTGFGYDVARRQFQARMLSELLVDYVNIRRIGSAALDLCLVAEGALEAYAEFGTQEWDWAAGALIAEEAGAPVGRPVGYPGWQYAGLIDPAKLRFPDSAPDTQPETDAQEDNSATSPAPAGGSTSGT